MLFRYLCLYSLAQILVTFQCQYFFMFFLQVTDIHAAVSDVKSKNIRCLSPEPRIGAHGKPVMFLHPKVVR